MTGWETVEMWQGTLFSIEPFDNLMLYLEDTV